MAVSRGIMRPTSRGKPWAGLELPSIGWQLFILDSSQSDPIALPAFLDTYATRLLTEPLRQSAGGERQGLWGYAGFRTPALPAEWRFRPKVLRWSLPMMGRS